TSRPLLTEPGSLKIEKIGYLTLVFDHRIVDGVPAANFLSTVKRFLEQPSSLE
ncbi:2-oxo acid dehydrogenase subunit E2, partial [Saccharolobus sp.]|uniref:2-oxo acid dehydrogenase subunit E2 n=1 Tax=Saccharolobus sp. TaxID=2100761 RepID=UPI00386FE066